MKIDFCKLPDFLFILTNLKFHLSFVLVIMDVFCDMSILDALGNYISDGLANYISQADGFDGIITRYLLKEYIKVIMGI